MVGVLDTLCRVRDVPKGQNFSYFFRADSISETKNSKAQQIEHWDLRSAVGGDCSVDAGWESTLFLSFRISLALTYLICALNIINSMVQSLQTQRIPRSLGLADHSQST